MSGDLRIRKGRRKLAQRLSLFVFAMITDFPDSLRDPDGAARNMAIIL